MQSKQRKNSAPSSNSRGMPPVTRGSDDHIPEMPPPMGTSSSQASQGSLDTDAVGARRRKAAGLGLPNATVIAVSTYRVRPHEGVRSIDVTYSNHRDSVGDGVQIRN